MIEVDIKDTMGQLLHTVGMKFTPSKGETLDVRDNTGYIISYTVIQVKHSCTVSALCPLHTATIIVSKEKE